jgi:hypothetical protein
MGGRPASRSGVAYNNVRINGGRVIGVIDGGTRHA